MKLTHPHANSTIDVPDDQAPRWQAQGWLPQTPTPDSPTPRKGSRKHPAGNPPAGPTTTDLVDDIEGETDAQ